MFTCSPGGVLTLGGPSPGGRHRVCRCAASFFFGAPGGKGGLRGPTDRIMAWPTDRVGLIFTAVRQVGHSYTMPVVLVGVWGELGDPNLVS